MGRTMGKSAAKYVTFRWSENARGKSGIKLLTIFFPPPLVLEVYQFARDAAVAEAWLIAQEPYLMSLEFGVSSNTARNERSIS